ncbi:MAG: hypothetical protein ACQEQD_04610 [Bacillota bacterium]
MAKKIAIADVMDTFNCDEKRARQIKGLIKDMAIQAFDEKIEREERIAKKEEIPF